MCWTMKFYFSAVQKQTALKKRIAGGYTWTRLAKDLKIKFKVKDEDFNKFEKHFV